METKEVQSYGKYKIGQVVVITPSDVPPSRHTIKKIVSITRSPEEIKGTSLPLHEFLLQFTDEENATAIDKPNPIKY